MIIDAHAHAFLPEDLRVLEERMTLLDASLPDQDPNKWYLRGRGDLEGMARDMAAAGVDRWVLLPVSGRPERVPELLRWVARAARDFPQVIPFGLLHPAGEVQRDLELILELGLKGIKLHPFVQRFVLSDPGPLEMLGLVAEAGLPVVVDTLYAPGMIRAKPHLKWIMETFGFKGCEPAHLAAAARAHPRLKLIAAHGGSLYGWDALEPLWDLDNLYFDISYLRGLIPDARVVELIRRKGPERVIYGSDAPWRRPGPYREWFESLPLGREERQQVAAGTIGRLVGL